MLLCYSFFCRRALSPSLLLFSNLAQTIPLTCRWQVVASKPVLEHPRVCAEQRRRDVRDLDRALRYAGSEGNFSCFLSLRIPRVAARVLLSLLLSLLKCRVLTMCTSSAWVVCNGVHVTHRCGVLLSFRYCFLCAQGVRIIPVAINSSYLKKARAPRDLLPCLFSLMSGAYRACAAHRRVVRCERRAR